MLKLVEESSGIGELVRQGSVLRQVRYSISRYQGIVEGSGMPVPGLFRIEGVIDAEAAAAVPELFGVPLTLRLDDGRALGVVLTGPDGRILSEGHGPSRCLCC